MATKKKISANEKKRAEVLEKMKEYLQNMKENLEGMVDAVDEMLQAESPEEIIDNIGGIDAEGLSGDADNINGMEFPEPDEDE